MAKAKTKVTKQPILKPDPRPIVIYKSTPYDMFKKEISSVLGSITDRISISWKILSYSTNTSSISLGHMSYSFIKSINICEGELEPEFSELNDILEKYCPNISILKYKKLLTDIVANEVESCGDELYGKKSVNLETLFNWLVDQKFINLLREPYIKME